MIAATDIVDVDGQPLVLATHLICRAPLRERVATTDLILDAAKVAAEQGLRFYFLGARPGVAAAAAEHLTARYPGLQIVGCRDGYFSQGEEEAICADVVAAGTDVLWLGLGSPLQDRFAARNRDRLAGLAWIRTCGGLFDYYSGDQPRAPWLMQVLGLEWLFRSLREPRRLGLRYLTTNPRAVPYHHQNARLRRPFSRGPARPGSDPHALGLQIGVDVFEAALAAKAAHLVAAEGHARVHGEIVVHPDRTGADALHRRHRLVDVARPHAARQAEAGGIGAGDHLVETVEGQDRGDGPKISSRAMRISSRTSAKTVGAT
jgi:exopolysaccharide biosynthesis WecB/TagA/CpsF family protein